MGQLEPIPVSNRHHTRTNDYSGSIFGCAHRDSDARIVSPARISGLHMLCSGSLVVAIATRSVRTTGVSCVYNLHPALLSASNQMKLFI